MKKLISVMLVCAMVCTMVIGCGNTGNGATANNAENTENNSGSEENAPAEEGSNGTIKIGEIGPITGPVAVYGLAVRNGAQIAVDEINAAGGINGMMIDYKYEDDEHDPEKAVNAYNNLKDWGIQALLGTVTSAPCVAVANETHVDNVFQLTPSGSAEDCVQYDNAFQVCFTDPNQGIASADYMAANMSDKKIAVIYDSSDVYSSGIYEQFKKKGDENGLEIVATEAYTSESNTDFTTQLTKAKDAGADLVFLPIYYSDATLILSQANTMGYAPTFFGCDGLDGILAVENFDISLAEGVVLLTPFAADATDERTVNFVTQYVDKYGDIPNQFAADAYDGIYIIKEAMEKAGVTSDMDASTICDLLKTAMTTISVDGLTGDGMTWVATGEVSKGPKAVVIKDGAYVAM